MAIPESQLETWSHQGSITQSSATYHAIRKALEFPLSAYAGKDYSIFLQGSYGNDTNIYAESDVDIVIRLNSCFYHDLEALDQNQKRTFSETYSASNYCYFEFRSDVQKLLKEMYGNSVNQGDKAITVRGDGRRRSADVLVATEFRRYYRFAGESDESHETGICFHRSDNTRIANYPRQHSANCTAKQQATNGRFKPMIRILKNLRSKLVERELIAVKLAPSYFIEGLLYNVPNDRFAGGYEESFVACMNWLLESDRSEFVCANGQYFLLRERSPVTWCESECEEFLAAARDLWRQW